MSNRALRSEGNLVDSQTDAMGNSREAGTCQNAFNALDLLKEGRDKVVTAFKDVTAGHGSPTEKITVGVVTTVGAIAAVVTYGAAVEAGVAIVSGATIAEGAAAAGAATEGAAVVETVASGAGVAGGVELAPINLIGPGGRVVATGAKDVGWAITDALRKAAGAKHYLP